ncbi:Fucose 4-O-acetylase [Nocardioides sp. AX2bis]|nr:Fucose 4-O-acetylase [Nocardioides sp. AX2bis]
MIGFLAIVVGHAAPGALTEHVIYTWHVPLFFFLTGYLWRPGRTLRDEVRRAFPALLVPYAGWLVLIGVPLLAWEAYSRSPISLVRRVGGMALGGEYLKSPFYAFWFVTALAMAAALYRVAERLGPRRIWLAAPALVLTLTPDWLSAIPLAAGVAVIAVFFVAVGEAFRRLRARVNWPVAVLGMTVALVLVIADFAQPLDLKYGDWGTPILSFVVAALISGSAVVLADMATSRFSPGAATAVTTAAGAGLVLVLAHGVPIYLLEGEVPTWVVVAASLAFAALAAWVVRRVPILTGNKPPHRQDASTSSSPPN